MCAWKSAGRRARAHGVDDGRSRVRSRPIVALEMLSDPCVRARVVKKYRPPNPTSDGALNAHTRVGIAECPNDASRPRARMRRMRRARQSARDDGRARFRDESARASNNALRGSRAEAGRARAGRVERRARDADGFRFVRIAIRRDCVWSANRARARANRDRARDARAVTKARSRGRRHGGDRDDEQPSGG